MGNPEYISAFIANTLSGRRREKNVVMLHWGRSGSTVLGHLLHKNPDIFWDSEIFIGNRMPAIPRPMNKLLFRAPGLVIGVRRQRSRKPVYGFESKPSQIARVGLNFAQFVAKLNAMHFSHYILLQRRNLLRIIISDSVAKQNGIWHRQRHRGHAVPKSSDQDARPSAIRIDVNAVALGSSFQRNRMSLLEHLRAIEDEYQQFNALLRDKTLLQMSYEEHIQQDPRVGYRRVCEFLAVSAPEVQVDLGKTNPWPVKEIVENYDEVADVLAGTPYEWMLND